MSDKFIDRLKKLDKERTQGDWEVIEAQDYAGGEIYHKVEATECTSYWPYICSNETYYPDAVSEENQRFIAEAPRMARILILIHEICKVVEQESDVGKIELILTEEHCLKLIQVVAESMVECAREVAEDLVSDTLLLTEVKD